MGKTIVLQAGAIAADARGECGICLIIVPTKVLVEQQVCNRVFLLFLSTKCKPFQAEVARK
jgi:superfamily II DNA or RNA helicase